MTNRRNDFFKEDFEADLERWFNLYLRQKYYDDNIQPQIDRLVKLHAIKTKTPKDWFEIRHLTKFIQENKVKREEGWGKDRWTLPQEVKPEPPNDLYRFASYLHQFQCGYDIDRCGWRYEESGYGCEHRDFLSDAEKFERRGGDLRKMIQMFEDYFLKNINNESEIKKALEIINVPGLD